MKHGTASAYRIHGCRCESCSRANREISKARRERHHDQRILVDGRLVAPLPEERHGTRFVYSEWGCRCEKCTRSHTDYWREHMQRKRDERLQQRRARAQQRIKNNPRPSMVDTQPEPEPEPEPRTLEELIAEHVESMRRLAAESEQAQ